MKLFNMFRQPYLDADDGANLGGGGMNDDAILPDDFTPDTQDEADGQKEDTNTRIDPEITMEQPKFRVKYNHEEKELGYDEAVPLIQKGMNYDKLQEKFDSIQNDPRLSKYERVAQVSKLLGYQSDDELLDVLYNTYYESAAEKQGYTPEQMRKDYELQQRELEIKQRETGEQQKQNTNAMYDRLLKAFPEIKPEDIKPETWGKVRNGVDLTTAYVEQRNQDLETRLKILEQNSKNLKKAPVGGVTSHGSAEADAEDDFLRGFNS